MRAKTRQKLLILATNKRKTERLYFLGSLHRYGTLTVGYELTRRRPLKLCVSSEVPETRLSE